MSRKITQETFNQAVEDTMELFGQSQREAEIEAEAQFIAQGVDLSEVATSSDSPIHHIKAAVTNLKDEKITLEDCLKELNALKELCGKVTAHKLVAGKIGAHDVILDIYLRSEDNKPIQVTCLKALVSIMTQHPDLLDERGRQVMFKNLEAQVDVEIKKLSLKWLKECCVFHEMNRQLFFEKNIVPLLTELLKEDSVDVLKGVLAVMRCLILDDDVRVEFGRAHEHARIIAGEALGHVTSLADKWKTDETLISDLLLTLSALLVRTEFCKTVDEVGGLDMIYDVMVRFADNEKINRQCFKLLKALAGNDDCKAHIIQKGFAPVICNSLSKHRATITNVTTGLACISAVSLRNADNSKALFEAELPEVIVDVMRRHPNEKSVQRTGSWAIRNMVSRSRYQNKHFLELGAEEVLKNNLAKFKEIEYDTKAALRDLECSVDFKEEWTGKGGMLNSDQALDAFDE